MDFILWHRKGLDLAILIKNGHLWCHVSYCIAGLTAHYVVAARGALAPLIRKFIRNFEESFVYI